MTVCLSPGGATIHAANQFSDQVMVATVNGIVVIKESSNGSWRQIASHLQGHHVCALLQDPDSGRFLAGTHDGGIALSDDGENWHFSNSGLDIENVYSLARSQQDGDTLLYAGTEPAALFCSSDLGESWTRVAGLDGASNTDTWTFPAPPFIGHVKSIAIDPQNAERIYLCVEQGGLYSTEDGGSTWTEHTAGMPNDAHRAIIHPQRPERIYLANGFFFNRSDDGGQTWFEMADQISRIGYADQLVYHPNKPDSMVVAGGYATPDAWATGSAKSAIYRTSDGGENWTQASTGLPDEIMPSFEAGSIEACGSASRIFLGNTHGEVWLSCDEGESWQQIIADIPWISKCFHADLIHGKLVLSEDDVQIPDELRVKMAEMVDRE